MLGAVDVGQGFTTDGKNCKVLLSPSAQLIATTPTRQFIGHMVACSVVFISADYIFLKRVNNFFNNLCDMSYFQVTYLVSSSRSMTMRSTPASADN